MKAALKAFSFAQVPHIMRVTSGSPLGASYKRETHRQVEVFLTARERLTGRRVVWSRSGQNFGGNIPSDGRLTRNERVEEEEMASAMAGWLYPSGRDPIWVKRSIRILPSASTM